MPSIPQSLLWISLVVLWLFVLVPMLISKRDAVRRTSDVALATRVLNGAGSRLLKRGGPAAGHRSDPHWKPEDDAAEADQDEHEEHEEEGETTDLRPARPVVVKVAAAEETEPDYLDVDVVEDSGALPAGTGAEMA
ncbi:gephyrin-like molybdotransferase receptor GlpR, partial [Mycobacterium sp.]|uniref:gephyrin-like molybdotransferase receptor GlpR n=1 Tax=Mycobacterium sp. TaxID=1785 RepID=UPI002B7FFAA5